MKKYVELPNGVKFYLKQFKNKRDFVEFKQFMDKVDDGSLDPNLWNEFCKFTINRYGNLSPENFMDNINEAIATQRALKNKE